jgi:type III pantothenate kinase
MKTAPDIVSVDIGNTRTHIGIVDTQACVCRIADAFSTGDLGKKLQDSVSALIGSVAIQPPETAAVSGTVKPAVAAAAAALTRMGFAVHVLGASKSLPISLCYTKPETLGTDRIANALYAHQRCPDERVIIISAGTALVIDCLSDHSFLGGVILPGAAMQFKALHTFTDGLPEIAIPHRVTQKVHLPGTSTELCMTSGVFHGLAGAINGFVGAYASAGDGRRSIVLATGGDWPVLAPLVDFEYTAVVDMTLIGTALYALTSKHP